MTNFLKQTPPTAIFGMLVILMTAILAVFAPWIAPYGETQIVGAEYLPWGGGYVLGTDNLGRDMLSRMIFGARNTVGLAILTTAIAFFIGSFLGIFVALKSGWIDQVIGRVVDILMAVPPLILALILLAALIIILGSGVWIAVAIGIVGLIAMVLSTSVPVGAVLATTVWSSSASWSLAALPLFIWMGEILFRSRLSEDMFKGL